MGVAGQDANRVTSELQRVRIAEQEKQRWLLGGAANAASLLDEVITVFLKHHTRWTADGGSWRRAKIKGPGRPMEDQLFFLSILVPMLFRRRRVCQRTGRLGGVEIPLSAIMGGME